jgi:hypothetical protein
MTPVMASLFIDHKSVGFAKYMIRTFPDGGPSKTADLLEAFSLRKGNEYYGKDSIANADIAVRP